MTFDSSRELEPLDYAGILDKSLDLYAKNLPFVLSVAAGVYGPLIVLHLIGLIFFPITLDVSRLRPMLEVPAFWQYMPLVDYAAIFVANSALLVALGYLLIGRRAAPTDVFRALKTRLPAIIGTSLLAAVAVFIGVRFLWVMGTLLFLPFAFIAEAVVLENRRYIDAIQRSVFMTLLGGEMVRVVIIAAVIGVVSFLANWIVGWFLGWLPSGDVMKMVITVLFDLLNLALTPFSIFAMTLLYIDIRVRYDQYDLHTLETELPE